MLISLLQSVLFIYIVNYCVGTEKILDTKKIVLCIILFFCISFIIPYKFGNFSIYIFVTHALCIAIIILVFKEKYFEALVSYSLIYSIVAIWIFVGGNLLYGVLVNVVPINGAYIYLSQIILFILCFKFKNKIKQMYKFLCLEKFSKIQIIMISLTLDFLVSFYLIIYDRDDFLLSKIVIVALFIFLGFNVIYFIKLARGIKQIYKLNENLVSKNNELKYIKNSHELQMLYLYELCNMEKYEDVAGLLKNIINKSENDTNISGKSIQDFSLLLFATRHVTSEEVNIIVEDTANFKLVAISELELYRVIVNIVNNAIKAMKNKGTLIIKSYEDLNNIIIKIENDGEEIPEEVIDKIFDSGFTTKKNNSRNHGYGLSIVKELLENYNGKISVESSSIRTKFTIFLPIKETT